MSMTSFDMTLDDMINQSRNSGPGRGRALGPPRGRGPRGSSGLHVRPSPQMIAKHESRGTRNLPFQNARLLQDGLQAAGISGCRVQNDHLTQDGVRAAGANSQISETRVYAAVDRFREFLLRPELLQAVEETGRAHPSEVQRCCIPRAISKMNLICEEKSGPERTSVLVLSTLHNIVTFDGQVTALVLCLTNEITSQISQEFQVLAAYLPHTKISTCYDGMDINIQKDLLKIERPHIVVGTPWRILELVRTDALSLGCLQILVLDECSVMLDSVDSRKVVQEILMTTPTWKQIMMFSAAISQKIRTTCLQFMPRMSSTYVYETQLDIQDLVQHYILLSEMEKNRRLKDLLSIQGFGRVNIFVKSGERAAALHSLLLENHFAATCAYSSLPRGESLSRHENLEQRTLKILVATDVVGGDTEMPPVNVVINYDMPESANAYSQRVCKAREGCTISFVSTEDDLFVIEQVRKTFEVNIKPYPERKDIR